MTHDVWDGDDEAEAGRLVPLYILVNGRTSPRNTSLDLATQVIALPADQSRLELEYREILQQCNGWISIAEIGAYLHRPLTITKVMVDVLHEQGFLDIGSPAQEKIADRWLLETVLAGLQRI
ncbi:Protein of unknown function (DUF742) [Micromonospora matsumotoense]|uniref:DUF742 domain-containing protein n=1 Tax=Micromonospora matsumotoense TaxID=121616 RepID=A0A1C4XMN7_9ACTN|nr:DUF742 domain-containing protein [Micromonospora matsumotoense]SCF09745.1 Protein of unknown function (DUF742) [Micromonospora matsumotoense]